jgi:DNA polymerase-3 subunit gamma/tau
MPLSRRYRPQSFQDVTGQSHITETLRNEVAQSLVGHAYLFSGPRGVGKTTSARIFAKALLCEKPEKGEPCNACDACREVTDGRCIDLVELDAASHTGVDNVREAIIEHVRFAPARWKRKIYVIDEAHMLSASAWNALLKTLEEPPSYAVFILATTELHKVPATILSRCQRFEFKRIAPDEMAARLKTIAKEEGITMDDETIAAVVRSADGYLRDGESLLEQLASLGQKKITRATAELVLPASRLPAAAALLGTCATRDVAASLKQLQELLDDGAAPLPLFDDLLAVVRMLLRAQDPSEASRLAAGDDGLRAVHALIGTYEIGELGDIALLLIERRRDAKGGVDPVFALELAVTAIAAGLLPHGPKSGQGGAMGAGAVRSVPGAATQPAPSKASHSETAAAVAERTASTPTPSVRAMKIPVPPAAPPVAQTTAPSPENAPSLHDVLIKWREVIRLVEKENRSLPFVLKTCQPESISGLTIVIRFQYPFHREKIVDDLKSKRIVEAALRIALGRDDLLIDGVVGELVGDADRPTTTDIVSKVLNAFGGTVVE